MELTLEEFKNFEALIYKTAGIRLQANKQSLLSNRLRRRVCALELRGFEEYYRLLNSAQGAGEMAEFLNAVTTNETSFFRTPAHFDWLQTDLISECIKQATLGQRSKQLRIWSAASSSGEEAYSIAIALAKNQLRLTGWKLEIVGTDISEEVVRRAQEATYQRKSLEDLDEKLLRRYFAPSADQTTWTARPVITSMVSFHQHNLLQPWMKQKFDCIFLRNVLIYFDKASKQAVLKNIKQALSPNGYLVLGPSEGVYDMLDGFTKSATFLYQKQGA